MLFPALEPRVCEVPWVEVRSHPLKRSSRLPRWGESAAAAQAPLGTVLTC